MGQATPIGQQPVVKCPACGSVNVSQVPLSMIEARYYKCAVCVITFREIAETSDPVDTFRFDRDMSTLPPRSKR